MDYYELFLIIIKKLLIFDIMARKEMQRVIFVSYSISYRCYNYASKHNKCIYLIIVPKKGKRHNYFCNGFYISPTDLRLGPLDIIMI